MIRREERGRGGLLRLDRHDKDRGPGRQHQTQFLHFELLTVCRLPLCSFSAFGQKLTVTIGKRSNELVVKVVAALANLR